MTSPAEAFAALSEAARAGAPSAEERRAALRRLRAALLARAEAAVRAADADFGGRSRIETLLADVLCVAEAAAHAARHLGPLDAAAAGGRALRLPPGPCPGGAVAEGGGRVIAPWNYPLQLALWPVVDALAAGNRVIVKPSEAAPRSAALVAEILAEGPGPAFARTVLGGPRGSGRPIGLATWPPAVHRRGSDRATGGAGGGGDPHPSPSNSGEMPRVRAAGGGSAAAARAILVGKALNAGQTCVAPDTVFLIGHSADAFAAACRATGPHAAETAIAPPNRARFAALLQGVEAKALAAAATSIFLVRAGLEAAIAHEEIFGPALLLREAGSLEEAIAAAAPGRLPPMCSAPPPPTGQAGRRAAGGGNR